ncbi:uncharacterized protein MKK02DRAFT_40092 [Dioszegia hungarica]|uniref:Cyclin N-terminal domain-containing protein n=1 Tax=Dioszegia hungarica TaxID=4972 RepID=A0AA38HEL9_9TREE|nr:uncharacterized protein MKK02DRAFT_40092 [Dioszegia hungarica]KAI9639767.1 hypothetical protein MKK02DRAFT_40092 [Dioszegia hungarica]
MSTVRASSASPSTSRKAVKASATASAPSSRPPTRGSDPYYGHEETSVMSARFITSLFSCPNIPTNVAPGAPTPTLAHFIAYALHRTRLPSIVTFAALLLLNRLKTRFPAARGSSGHRLFISAFMIASKVICDDTYSNQSWGIVAQKMFALKEINQMEREMCGYLEWNLNVAGPEVLDFESRVRAEHGAGAVARETSSSSSSSSGTSSLYATPVHSYPTPDTTPDPSRPIRPVPSPYKSRAAYREPQPSRATFPSPPASPQHSHHAHHSYHLSPPHFASANSSLVSSPASDDCKTPSPVAVTQPTSASSRSKGGIDQAYARRHVQAHYPISSNVW